MGGVGSSQASGQRGHLLWGCVQGRGDGHPVQDTLSAVTTSGGALLRSYRRRYHPACQAVVFPLLESSEGIIVRVNPNGPLYAIR